MAIRICDGYNDPMFKDYEDRFYNNFTADDWDYIIVGKTKRAVEKHAKKRMVCVYQIKMVGDEWIAVTYHS